MPRIVFDHRKVNCVKGEGYTFTLPDFGDHIDVHVWFSSDNDVVVYAEDKELNRYPLAKCSDLDQVYTFHPGVIALTIEPKTKATNYMYRVTYKTPRYFEAVDPTPYELPVPLDENSAEQRMLRMISAEMDRRGITTDNDYRGNEYEPTDDFSEDDTEFGRGYQFDERADADIRNAATRAVLERYLGDGVRSTEDTTHDKSGGVVDPGAGEPEPPSERPKPPRASNSDNAPYDKRDGAPLPN